MIAGAGITIGQYAGCAADVWECRQALRVEEVMQKIKTVGYGRATLVDGNKRFMRTVRIPILFDSIPGVPAVIRLGKELAVKVESAPLTYQWIDKPCVAYEEGHVISQR